MRNNHEGKENHLLELCSGHSQLWVFVTALPKRPRLSQQQHFTVNSVLGKNSWLSTSHCNKPFPAGSVPLGDPPAPGIHCAIKTLCAIKPPMLPENQNFLEIKFTPAAYFLFNPGAQVNLGNLSLQLQKCKWEKMCINEAFYLMGKCNSRFCHSLESWND